MNKTILTIAIIGMFQFTALADTDLSASLKDINTALSSRNFTSFQHHSLTTQEIQPILKAKLPDKFFIKNLQKWFKQVITILDMGFKIDAIVIKDVTFIPKGKKINRSLIAVTTEIIFKKQPGNQTKTAHLYCFIVKGKWKFSSKK